MDMGDLGFEIKVRIAKGGKSKKVGYRGFYLPLALYKLLGEPDSFVLEDLDVKERRIVMRAIKKSEGEGNEGK